MYSLSSEEALNDFVSAPRDFLLPPNPKIPCKVCIVGPPLSGKSTLVKSIADKYDAMVSIQCTYELYSHVYEICVHVRLPTLCKYGMRPKY